MNSIWAIAFVVVATILGKWLLWDNDSPVSEADDCPNLRIADPVSDSSASPLSKSA